MRRRWWPLVSLAVLVWGSCVHAQPELEETTRPTTVVTRDFWSFEAIEWGDGRPYDKPVKREGPYPQGFKADYRIEIPATGWYELLLTGTGAMTHDLLVDGRWSYRYGQLVSGADGDFVEKSTAKAANLFLTAGVHTLRIQRVGRPSFPITLFGGFELRTAEGRPSCCVTAEKPGPDVLRVGQPFPLRVTGGGAGRPLRYELLRRDLLHPDAAPEVVGAVDFPASNTPVTREVTIATPREGVYQIRARAGGQPLRPAEFRAGDYIVVDVNAPPAAAAGDKTLVHDIDCVAQTDLGKPLDPRTFFECNGRTRITASRAGIYRESNDCTGPEVEQPKTPIQYPRSYSGFAYEVALPDDTSAYLLEIDYPDDDRRSVTIPVTYLADDTGEMMNGSYSGKSYETGGMFPLSDAMTTHRVVFWASSHRVNIGLLSQQIGQRAAAARIRISRFTHGLPAMPVVKRGGRTFAHWYEEGENWKLVVNAAPLYRGRPEIAADYLAMQRWVQLARYAGMNGISGVGVGYQSAFYRTKVLDGFMPCTYDQARLMTLLCEKYGMKYIAEVFPNQWYYDLMIMDRQVKDKDELKPISCQGILTGPSYGANTRNALHPVVQDHWVNALGELADKLRDSPAFAGITVRLDGWLYNGQFALPSLNWGYSDWTIAQFTRDTGVQVPGAPGDPQRYAQRYRFLTAGAMRAQWINWRGARTLAYHRRLRDRIRGERKDIVFGLVGDADCDSCYAVPEDIRDRFQGMGVDLDAMTREEGIAVIPYARYGARNTTSAEQAIYDGFLDPAMKGAGRGQVRGFAAYMVYHELGEHIPYDKLGVKATKFYYCSAVDAAGRHTLQKFAVALADQDSAILRDGGNAYIFGDPEVWEPWFAEFRALPALPFTQLAAAQDPVAVWQRACPDGYYFYAVNREQYPVTISLTLRGAASLTRLGTGEAIPLQAGRLTLTLAPYELRSFRAPQKAAITGAEALVPEDRIDFVKDRLVFAQELAREITTGVYREQVSAEDRAAFQRGLRTAWDAFARKHYWRARTVLSMAPMMRVYEATGCLPAGQVVARFPNLLREKPGAYYALGEPLMPAAELAVAKECPATLTDSRQWQQEWGGARVLKADNGYLELLLTAPAAGRYRLTVGHVAPAAGVTTAAINGASLPLPIVTREPGHPDMLAFPPVAVPAGTVRVTLRRDGPFGVYALKWLPALRPLPTELWSVVGPFTTVWGQGEGREGYTDAAVLKSFTRVFPPEGKVDLTAVYHDQGRELRWQQKRDTITGFIDTCGVDMTARTASPGMDVNFAACFITSPDERTVLMSFATDWWANIYINGEKVTSDIDRSAVAACGAEFNTKRYRTGLLHLQPGVNTLLVKNQGGSGGNSFSMYLSDMPDLQITPMPPQ